MLYAAVLRVLNSEALYSEVMRTLESQLEKACGMFPCIPTPQDLKIEVVYPLGLDCAHRVLSHTECCNWLANARHGKPECGRVVVTLLLHVLNIPQIVSPLL